MDSESANHGTSKYRRQQLNNAIGQLKNVIPLPHDVIENLSQLQALHFACIFMRKQKLMSNLDKYFTTSKNDMKYEQIFKNIVGSQFGMSDAIHGFIIVVSREGHLLYVSENVVNYLGHSAIDVLLYADKFYDILHPMDESKVKSILDGKTVNADNSYEFLTSWYVSKIKRRVFTNKSDTKVKIRGRFVADNSLFVALCTPILRVAERDYMDYLVAASPVCFTSIHSLDLRFNELCEKGQNILGYNEGDLNRATLYDITNIKNLSNLRKNHKSLLNNKSQRGKLETVQLLHKNGSYINCLLNMYYGNSNYIICRYQVFSQTEMAEYENYNSMTESYNKNVALQSDEFDGSDQQLSPSSTKSSNYSSDQTERKRRFDDDSNDDDAETSENDENSTNHFDIVSKSKRLKCEAKSPLQSFKIEIDATNNSNVFNYETSNNTNCQNIQQYNFPSPPPPPYQTQTQTPPPAYQSPQAQTKQFAYYPQQATTPNQITDEDIEKLTAELIYTNRQISFNVDEFNDIDFESINTNDLLTFSLDDIKFPNLTNDDSYSSASSPQEITNFSFNENKHHYNQNIDHEFIVSLIA